MSDKVMFNVQSIFRDQFCFDSTTLNAGGAKRKDRDELEPSPAEKGEVRLSYGV